jgi:hypothetical protein
MSVQADHKPKNELSQATQRLAVRLLMAELFRPRPSYWDRVFAQIDEPIHRWEDDGGGPR